MSQNALTAQADTAGTAGFYGKIPIRGDFITRHLPRSFIQPWDRWLQAALTHSREQLGEHWLDYYLTSPLWRFVLGSGLCSEQAYTGVFMPSVDRVGRYYPLVVAAPLHTQQSTFALVLHAEHWFEQLEQLTLDALEDDFDLESFDGALLALGPAPMANRHHSDAPDSATWHCVLSDISLVQGLPALTEHLVERSFGRYSLWWTSGSERIQPCLTICSAMPPTTGFAALLTGDWLRCGWRDVVLSTPGRTAVESSS